MMDETAKMPLWIKIVLGFIAFFFIANIFFSCLFAVSNAISAAGAWVASNVAPLMLAAVLCGVGYYARNHWAEIRSWWKRRKEAKEARVIDAEYEVKEDRKSLSTPRKGLSAPRKALPAATKPEVRVIGFTTDKQPQRRK